MKKLKLWFSNIWFWLRTSSCDFCGTRHRHVYSYGYGEHACGECWRHEKQAQYEMDERYELDKAVKEEKRRIQARRIAEMELERHYREFWSYSRTADLERRTTLLSVSDTEEIYARLEAGDDAIWRGLYAASQTWDADRRTMVGGGSVRLEDGVIMEIFPTEEPILCAREPYVRTRYGLLPRLHEDQQQ